MQLRRKRQFQIILTLSIFVLLSLSTSLFVYFTRTYIYSELVHQILNDNRVIGNSILTIIDQAYIEKIGNPHEGPVPEHSVPLVGASDKDSYSQAAEGEIVQRLQIISDHLELPNHGFMCAVDSTGKLVAAPGLGETAAKDLGDATFYASESGKEYSITEMPEDFEFEGLGHFPKRNTTDIIVSMPVPNTPFRVLIHQSNEAVKAKARRYTTMILLFGVAFVLLVSGGVYILVNRQVSKYESDLEMVNNEVEATNRRLEEINVTREQLIHILSHDLRNPIGSMISAIEVIEEEPDLLEEFFPMIKKSANNCLNIIDLVRKTEAIGSGKLSLDIESVPLRGAVERSLEVLRGEIEKKEIHLDISGLGSHKVLAERTSLSNSVLNNLLSNSIKFSHRGGVIRIVTAELHSKNPEKREGVGDNQVVLKIIDQGIGIPQTVLKNIFNPGSRISREGTDGEEGTGYGMPLVHRLVAAYGGRVEIESHSLEDGPGEEGTRVSVFFRSACL